QTAAGQAIYAARKLLDGSTIDGLGGVQAMLLRQPELFVHAFTEKLMMYALGRNVQYYDPTAIRSILRSAAAKRYAFSTIVEGIVESVPFRMRNVHASAAGQTVGVAHESEGVDR